MTKVSKYKRLLLLASVVICTFVLPGCGGGGGGGGGYTPQYGSVDGYVYAPYGSAPVNRTAESPAAGNKPVSGAKVDAKCGATTKTATTNTSGYYKISSLPTGSCSIKISSTGYQDQQFSVSVKANSVTSGGEKYFSSTTSGSIKVNVNVSGGTIYVDGQNTSLTMPESLTYTLSGLSAGIHTIGMTKTGVGSVPSQNVTVTAGQTVEASFVLNPTGNRAPVANAGQDAVWFAGYQYIDQGWNGSTFTYTGKEISYTLNGTGSSDPDGNQLTYNWTQVSGPTVALTNGTASSSTFIPAQSGIYQFKLKVADGYLASEDTVNIDIRKLSGKILFESANGNHYDIFSFDFGKSVSTSLKLLTFETFQHGHPTWSPDGKKILYSCAPTGGFNYQICRMNEDGSGIETITDSTIIASQPSYSPDGSKIIYIKDIGSIYHREVFKMNTDSSGKTQLTNLTTANPIAQKPRYSPDGTKILFGMTDSDILDIEVAVMNADGSGLSVLTSGTLAHPYPNWTSDGRVLFTEFNTNNMSVNKLFVINSNGSGLSQWTFPTGVNYTHYVDMTDDGKFIYYSDTNGYIHAMTADSSADINLGVYGINLDYHP